MDYKEKYEAALELARQYYDENTNQFLDTIFPELAESEDERIRKRLLEYFQGFLKGYEDCYKDGGSVRWEGLDAKSIIAWLEKQKEPVPIPDKFSGLKSLMLQYLQSAANRKDDTEIESDTDLWGRKILDYVWKQDEKQQEQKPSEEQMNGLAHAINLDVYDAKRYHLESLYNDLKKLM